ncbi:conserved hypothetical protein [Beutenbergia cavernae DSM 12333]|uniref:DoxX family protein n=1 Tax=Beutenbergia cavernae (strain ATCC BAA-8 / DSM 12333 / CCUG 43141 / JCM 11478 / NBRC 16432 / NCIMB 13614 / HKI 0122) TaxID=471853 RepID=C5BYA9_BEUC1|nr:hypothetical protein [Beutenbergia cavernae]ACQ81009.1 conserved hypothetical protein [Beutenbergia cavernae DSM 12333]
MAFALRRIPPRVAAGAFILNSGLGKSSLDAETAAHLHAQAVRAFPQLKDIDPKEFGKLLSAAEIGLGGALLLPFVPSGLAGLGLAGFSGALLWMYHKTPGATVDGVRPTPSGIGLAKDVFMLGIGLGLLVDVATTRKRR